MAESTRTFKRYGKRYHRMTIGSKTYNIPIELLEYALSHGITKMAIRNRLRYGWNLKKACTEGIIDDKNSRTK